MINFNGSLVTETTLLSVNNRAFLFGDGVFETVKIVDNKILFFEEHYFRLMAAMRIVRMEIPMSFTMEYLEEQIISLAKANSIENSARARITVYRNEGGYYLPVTNEVSFIVQVSPLPLKTYRIEKNDYEVDLYKDFFITKQLISTVKTTNKIINITGSIFAKENRLDNCLLLNDQKNVIEALQANIFMIKDNILITPPVSEGCHMGIFRKKVFELVKKLNLIELIEAPISPFDLQKAEELFLTNVIFGIQPITKYRKKEFETKFSSSLLEKFNEHYI
jgi:branched-chain amino acid aminotransferase